MDRHVNDHYIEHFGQGLVHQFCPALQRLAAEHHLFLAKMEDLIASIDEGEEEDIPSLLGKINEQLEDHSQSEETHLFPLINQYLGTKHGPMEIMELEHEEIRKHFSGAIQQQGKNQVEQAIHIDKAYAVMQQHFYKEENAIFPMAEQFLSSEEKDKLYQILLDKDQDKIIE
jgi:regulator of cell morphogenesis and NO signaling